MHPCPLWATLNCVKTSKCHFRCRFQKCFLMVEWKKVQDEVPLILTKRYKMEERVKTEHHFATQTVSKHFVICLFAPFLFWKWKWRDIRPSMVNHTRNLCSAFNPSKVQTHSSEHTHTVNTHPEQWAAIYAAAPGEQLGARCLAQGQLSHGIEGGESTVHSLPPPTIPAGPETRTHNLWITSTTL